MDERSFCKAVDESLSRYGYSEGDWELTTSSSLDRTHPGIPYSRTQEFTASMRYYRSVWSPAIQEEFPSTTDPFYDFVLTYGIELSSRGPWPGGEWAPISHYMSGLFNRPDATLRKIIELEQREHGSRGHNSRIMWSAHADEDARMRLDPMDWLWDADKSNVYAGKRISQVFKQLYDGAVLFHMPFEQAIDKVAEIFAAKTPCHAALSR